MSLVITAVHGEPDRDTYGNLSYWVSIEGVEGNALVKHKGDKPPLKPGDDAEQHGFNRVENVEKKNGAGTYKKLMRPEFRGQQGSNRPRDPAERKSIEMQASHKVAVDIARIAIEGLEVKPDSEQITQVVMRTARALFDQIEEVAK